jgi:hypothetical protein
MFTFAAATMLLIGHANGQSPPFRDIEVTDFLEASGVALKEKNTYILGSDTKIDSFLEINDNGQRKDIVLKTGLNICDCEDVEIVYDSTMKKWRLFALSEDFNRVYIEDGDPLDLADFKEVCERGAEGLSVRKNRNGIWEMVVIWEGGYLEDKDLPRGIDMKPDCSHSKIKKGPCNETQLPKNPKYVNPKIVYLTSQNGILFVEKSRREL